MTVSSTSNRKTFAGDNATTSFGTSPVVFYDTSDLVVTVVDDTTGAETALVENTDYTVSGGSGSTGTISLAGGTSPHGALLTDTTLVVLRTLPLTQSADFVNNDINDADVLERALDKAAMRDQQLSEENDRALRLAATETPTDDLTVIPFDRASKYLGFDASKNLVALDAPTSTSLTTAYTQTLLLAGSAATARTILEAPSAADPAFTGTTLTLGAGMAIVAEGTTADAFETTLAFEDPTADRTVTVPNATTTLVGTDNAQTLSNKTLVAPALGTPASGVLTNCTNTTISGTTQSTASGTAFDFTGLPTSVKRLTINFSNVSLSGTDDLLVQLGDSGGFETSGYVGVWGEFDAAAQSVTNSTSGFVVKVGNAARSFSGVLVLTLLDAATFSWVASGSGKTTSGIVGTGGGDKSLSAELTQVRVTRTGTDTFDGGNVNILYDR